MEIKTRISKDGFPVLYYANVEQEYLVFKKGIRVLPAQYFTDKKLRFTFRGYFAPGTNKWFPNGGFEVTGPGGEYRAYERDQVIVHPEIFEEAKHLEKVLKKREKREQSALDKTEKISKKREREVEDAIPKKRGRRPLTETQRKQRELERLLEPERSHEKGRKRLDPDQRIKREAEKLAQRILKGMTGKRGRPSDPEKKLQRQTDKAIRQQRSGGKRGRPKTK